MADGLQAELAVHYLKVHSYPLTYVFSVAFLSLCSWRYLSLCRGLYYLGRNWKLTTQSTLTSHLPQTPTITWTQAWTGSTATWSRTTVIAAPQRRWSTFLPSPKRSLRKQSWTMSLSTATFSTQSYSRWMARDRLSFCLRPKRRRLRPLCRSMPARSRVTRSGSLSPRCRVYKPHQGKAPVALTRPLRALFRKHFRLRCESCALFSNTDAVWAVPPPDLRFFFSLNTGLSPKGFCVSFHILFVRLSKDIYPFIFVSWYSELEGLLIVCRDIILLPV